MKSDLRAEVAASRQALKDEYLRRPDPRTLLEAFRSFTPVTVSKWM